jgi:hypothetical protein
MTNLILTENGKAVLSNPSFAEAISMAIANNSCTPEGDAILVEYRGKKFRLTRAFCPTQDDLKNAAK